MRKFLIILFAMLFGSAAMAGGGEYSYGPHPKQALDVYLPPNPQNAPIIVMLHGGGWHVGDKANSKVAGAKAKYWNGEGRIFVSVNTRLMPDAGPLDQARDLARAMAFVQKNASAWGGNPNQMILVGHSSGGHIAALLSTRQDLQREAGLSRWDGTVVLDSLAYDVPTMMRDDSSRAKVAAFGQDRNYWTSTSPDEFLDQSDPPMLLVCSSKRRTSCSYAKSFAAQGRNAGVSMEVIPVPFKHEAINAQLGRNRKYTQAVDDWISHHLN